MSELAKINGYDIRDKKLADEGTVTTASSTDYVLLEDTNGNYQKIAKNSFTEAVRNTLGDLLRTNDKGTSITGVPALSGSGTSESPYDFGSISTANLASVLGGFRFIKDNPSDNLNDFTETGLYFVDSYHYSNFPFSPRYQFSCFLLVVAQNQFLWHDSMIEGDGIYCRRFNYGGTWHKLAFS